LLGFSENSLSDESHRICLSPSRNSDLSIEWHVIQRAEF
jgi:hypothetical protein